MDYWEDASEVPNVGDIHPTLQKTPRYKLRITEDAEYDNESQWNQMDALAKHSTIHDVRISQGTQWHPDYASPETDLFISICHTCSLMSKARPVDS